jgi:hypothetical protein
MISSYMGKLWIWDIGGNFNRNNGCSIPEI